VGAAVIAADPPPPPPPPPVRSIQVKTKPKRPGVDKWSLSPQKDVSVSLNGNETEAGKAKKIRDAINKLPPVVGEDKVSAALDPADNTKVNITGRSVNIAKLEDPTGEETKEGVDHGGFKLILDFHGSPSGTEDGTPLLPSESLFRGSFGFDGLLADFSFNFSELSSPTLAGILTDAYNELRSDLPLSFQPRLSLDLANEQIVFISPLGETNYFVSTYTTDITVVSTTEISGVPEPSGLILIGSAATFLALLKFVALQNSNIVIKDAGTQGEG